MTRTLNWLKGNWYKLLIAVFLLGALGEHPYVYYQILRWAVCIAAAFTAVQFHEKERMGWMWVFIGIAILFNPIAPIFMSRESWQAPDVIAAFVFLIAAFLPTKKQHEG